MRLNGNEKLYNFPTNPNAGPLPTNASKPGTIQTGDLMLYGSNTLVLFYKSFSTPYSYTKLGRIDNPAELSAALGFGRITATFDLE
ncbi:cyclophilin-like fold protein [Spirosoma areae]